MNEKCVLCKRAFIFQKYSFWCSILSFIEKTNFILIAHPLASARAWPWGGVWVVAGGRGGEGCREGHGGRGRNVVRYMRRVAGRRGRVHLGGNTRSAGLGGARGDRGADGSHGAGGRGSLLYDGGGASNNLSGGAGTLGAGGSAGGGAAALVDVGGLRHWASHGTGGRLDGNLVGRSLAGRGSHV